MNVHKLFPSKWLSAVDLDGKAFTLTIRGLTLEDVGQPPKNETKPVLWFESAEKGLILNKTNGLAVADLYGPETDNWIGKPVMLYTAQVRAFGNTVDAIRIRGANVVSAAPPPVVEAEPEDVADFDNGHDDEPDHDLDSITVDDDTPDDGAAHIAIVNGNGNGAQPAPPMFKNPDDAKQWALDLEAFADKEEADAAYAEVRKDVKPSNAGEMFAAWIAAVNAQVERMGPDYREAVVA
jgi:hypothetical protein